MAHGRLDELDLARLHESDLLELYRRGVRAIVYTWSALNLLLAHRAGGGGGGGSVSDEAKREWLIETLLEAGYCGKIDVAAAEGQEEGGGGGGSGGGGHVKTGNRDELADVILQIIQDEYDTSLEDDSDQDVAALVFRLKNELWPRGIVGVGPCVPGPGEAEEGAPRTSLALLVQLEARLHASRRRAPQPVESDATDETDGDDDDVGDDTAGRASGRGQVEGQTMDIDEQPRGSSSNAPRFDEDGFQIVQRRR